MCIMKKESRKLGLLTHSNIDFFKTKIYVNKRSSVYVLLTQ